MPRLLISCSKCERKLYTGLALESWFVLEWVDIQSATTHCRACGTENTWDKSDTFLEADGGGG